MGQTPLPSTPEPPGPPNPPAPGFPRLRETFKSGLGRHRVLLISSGRSTPAPSRAICSETETHQGAGDTQPARGPSTQQTPAHGCRQGSAGLRGSRGSRFSQRIAWRAAGAPSSQCLRAPPPSQSRWGSQRLLAGPAWRRAGRCHEDVYGWQTWGSHTQRAPKPWGGQHKEHA